MNWTGVISSCLCLLLFTGGTQCQEKPNRTTSSSFLPPPRGCFKLCPRGYKCEWKPLCFVLYSGAKICFGSREICVKQRPLFPSCKNKKCGSLETCAYRQPVCVTYPCNPLVVCIPNGCITALCPRGKTCITEVIPGSNPACLNFPQCRYRPNCVPVARPKRGFCPPPGEVSHANVNQCDYDNQCPADLLCCPGASRGGRACAAPLYPDPCQQKRCPSHAPTCVLLGGRGACRNPECTPGSFFCREGRQCYCTDQGQIQCTFPGSGATCALG